MEKSIWVQVPFRAPHLVMKKIEKTNIKETLRSYLPLAILLVIFCAICIPTLFRPLWFDEAYSSNLIRGDFGQIAKMTALDVHPPFYYWCLKVWSMIFGRTTFALRTLSVFFSVISIICLYILTKRWSKSNKTAVILTSLFAACPFFIFYSGEMRMYSLSCLIVISGTLLLDLALEKNKKILWLLYSFSIIAALYTHYFAALGFLAHFIFLIFYFKKHGFNKNIIWVYILAVVAYIPWIPIVLAQTNGVENGYWPNPITPLTFIRFFSYSFVYYEAIESNLYHLSVTVIAVIIMLIVALMSVPQMGKSTKEKTFLVALLTFIPPAVLIIISVIGESVYVERYITYAIAFLWVLFGILALSAGKERPIITTIFIALMIICFGTGIKNVYKILSLKDPFETIITRINEFDDQEAPIVYYSSDAGAIHSTIYETELHPVYSYNIDTRWGAVVPIMEYERNYISDFEAFKEKTDAFWYISSIKYPRYSINNEIGNKFIGETEFREDNFIVIRFVKKESQK